jgi:hypothetical protein
MDDPNEEIAAAEARKAIALLHITPKRHNACVW